MPAASSRVFISYRREETAYPAGWLYDRLDERFGDAQVFKDVDSIPLGDDFVAAITTAVGSCDVLLALIGDKWLTITDERGRRRLDDPHDFVRLEIEAALARNVRLIPVLVDGARMPRADELPDSLAGLVRRQALELSPSRFDSDTNRLARVLASTLAEVRAETQGPDHRDAAPDGAAASTTAEPRRTVGTVPSLRVPPSHTRWRVRPPSGPRAPTRPGRRCRPRRGLVPVIAAVAVVVAVLAVIAAIVVIAGDDDEGDDTGDQSGSGIEFDDSPVTSLDGLELSELSPDVRNDPPLVGDTLTLSYALTNTTDEPVEFAYTYVGARNPDDENRDPEDMNEEAVLEPGETLEAEGRVLLDSDGTWVVWPCYELAGGEVCPDEWQAISFLVE